MADWARKHLHDLSDTLERHKTRGTLSRVALDDFAALGKRARNLSKHPSSSDEHSVQELILAWCRVCSNAGCFRCNGRTHWTAPCAFIHQG